MMYAYSRTHFKDNRKIVKLFKIHGLIFKTINQFLFVLCHIFSCKAVKDNKTDLRELSGYDNIIANIDISSFCIKSRTKNWCNIVIFAT